MLKANTGLYIIIFGAALLIVVIFYFFIPRGGGDVVEIEVEDVVVDVVIEQEQSPSLTENNKEDEISQVEPERIYIEAPKEITREEKMSIFEIERLAASFVERYGSYSNQANFSNLENLLMFMTASNKRETQKYILEERAKQNGANANIYYGMTTRVVAKEVQDYEEGDNQVKVLVDTVRFEAIGTVSNKNRKEQQAYIYMKKERGAWKVDSVEWL